MAQPRVGFLGVGWIGRSRLRAMAETGVVEVAAVAEPDDSAAAEALALSPGAQRVEDLDALLALGLDGVVVATPSALHAKQSLRALASGAAVFCQKPLGRNTAEVGAVVEAASRADRLLGVDLSYRFAKGMREVREAVRGGRLGRVYAADLTFHNAYGPDKAWFRDRRLSGGGCVIDLGVHLVDLALWTLGSSKMSRVTSSLFANGRRLAVSDDAVEDFATAELVLESGEAVRIACSWNLPAGTEAVIEAQFWGANGGAAFRNVGGSFFDFQAELTEGSDRRTLLSAPPEAWSGRAAADWATRLASGERYDPRSEDLVSVARILDAIYASAG